MSHQPTDQHPSKHAELDVVHHADSRPKSNIPGALLNDPRCPKALAHYVFDFVDSANVLFSILLLDYATHNNHALMDDKWWKRRLAHDFGSKVTRWSDEVLILMHTKYSDQVSHQPLWFGAALSLYSRLKRIARDFFGQNENNMRLPKALIHVLVVSPPFLGCVSHIKCQYWLLLEDLPWGDHSAEAENYHWFAGYNFNSSRSKDAHFLALYSGECYCEDEINTKTMGELVEGTSYRRVRFDDPNLWPVVLWHTYKEGSHFDWYDNMHDFCIKESVYEWCNRLHKRYDRAADAMLQASKQQPHINSGGNTFQQGQMAISWTIDDEFWDRKSSLSTLGSERCFDYSVHPELAPSVKVNLRSMSTLTAELYSKTDWPGSQEDEEEAMEREMDERRERRERGEIVDSDVDEYE